MIALMMIVMGTGGSGYLSPLNLGIPAFVKTITPPLAMVPTMMGSMGIHLPPAVMSTMTPALASGHIPSMMMHQLAAMLTAMHLPDAKVHMMGALMSGHASNAMMADLLAGMSSTGRAAVMHAMPVDAGHVIIGALTHFALAVGMGVALAMMIIGVGIGRLGLAPLRTPAGIVVASILAAAAVYALNRWVVLPAIDPMMRLVPETAFFIGHLLFGAIVGLGIVLIGAREGVLSSAWSRSAVTA